jgi:glycosyltransferase involved in cell wall biosynthesis
MKLSVIIPTHNPHRGRLVRTLEGLRGQTLDKALWELLLIDNASQDPESIRALDLTWHPQARIIREETLGLTAARLRGFSESSGEVIVLVDDDNILARNYLELVVAAFASDPSLGATGGRSFPDYESPPPAWLSPFEGLLALRDPGDTPSRAAWSDGSPHTYPLCAPIGAGMALRRSGAVAYAKALNKDSRRRRFDRTGTQLTSGGDNDLVMTILETGLAVSYLPALELKHIIPEGRLQTKYLGALNRAIARSWIRVLALHGIQPWQPIKRATVPLRQAKSWFRNRAWRGPAAWIKWQGTCGHFTGLADLNDHSA